MTPGRTIGPRPAYRGYLFVDAGFRTGWAMARRRDRRDRLAARPPLGIQPLEPRIACAVLAGPQPAAAATSGPSVIAFAPPVVSGRRVSVEVAFNEGVRLRGAAGIPYDVGGHPRFLALATGTWPARVLSFTDTLPAGQAPPGQRSLADRIVLGPGAAIVDRAGHPAVSLARPTDVTLSAAVVPENRPPGTVVGTLGAVDPDGSRDRFTYSLVAGSGALDNASFRIVAGRLVTRGAFDYEAKDSYAVRIRATDSGGLVAERTFRIDVANVPEAPASGRVLDGLWGYLAAARVFADGNGDRRLDWADADGDGRWDPGEGEVFTTTGDAGSFAADFGDPAAVLVAIGGHDSVAAEYRLPTDVFLAAPAGSGVVSPLTTLVVSAAAGATGGDLAAARELVNRGLGLPAGFDPGRQDPLAEGDLAAVKAAALVADVVVKAAQVHDGGAAVLRRFVAAFGATPGPLDLASPDVVAGLVGGNAHPADPRTKLLAADNARVAAAATLAEVRAAARAAQTDAVVIVDGTPPSAVVYDYSMSGNPFRLWMWWVTSLGGPDEDFLTLDGAGRVHLAATADIRVKSLYTFALTVFQPGGHLRPPMGGTLDVVLRVVPAA